MCIEMLTRQPTIRLANTSMMSTRYYQSCQVETYVKSLTQSWFYRLARNCRLTLSIGSSTLASAVVVRTILPRITPRNPILRIRRSTV